MGEVPYYWKALNWDAFMADYPPPPLFEQSFNALSDDALRALQEKRFLARVADAWKVPFYRRRWTAAGLDEGSIRSLDDLCHIPTFTSDDLAGAIKDRPPYGDHHPFSDPESLTA